MYVVFFFFNRIQKFPAKKFCLYPLFVQINDSSGIYEKKNETADDTGSSCYDITTHNAPLRKYVLIPSQKLWDE